MEIEIQSHADGDPIQALLFSVGVIVYSHKKCAERAIKVTGETPELTKISKSSDEALRNVMKLMDMVSNKTESKANEKTS